MENANPPPTSNRHVLPAALRVQGNDSDDGEVFNELIEYENVGKLCREMEINSFDGNDLAFQCMIGFRKFVAYFDPFLPMNIITCKAYNTIMPSASTPVVAEMHKEAQQATSGPTYLGVTGELLSLYTPSLHQDPNASTYSTPEADPRIFAPKDLSSQQHVIDEGTQKYSFDHIITGNEKEASNELEFDTSPEFRSLMMLMKRSSSLKTTPQPEGEKVNDKGKKAFSHEEADEEESESESDAEVRMTSSLKKIKQRVKADVAKAKIQKGKEELIDLVGLDVVEKMYKYTVKYDKYCFKMLNQRASGKITNFDVLSRGKGLITLKVYMDDGFDEIIQNFKASDLHLGN
nr:hypothetical protein [Tanacetum cinerariifolium]